MVPSTFAQRARPERVDRRLDRRRAHRKRVVGIASRVQDLQQDLAALVVHGVGDAAMPTGVRRRHHLRRRTAAASRCGSGAYPPVMIRPTPPRARSAKYAASRSGVAGAVLQAGVHRTHHHPVAQRGEPKIQRRQQVRIRVGHASLLQARRHFVEPVDGALLGPDAAAQHQVLVQRAATRARSGRGTAASRTPVGVEQLGAFGAQRGDLLAQRGDVAVGGAADLDRQIAGAVVGHRTARGPSTVRRSSGPTRRGPRRRRCRPSCPACPAARRA